MTKRLELQLAEPCTESDIIVSEDDIGTIEQYSDEDLQGFDEVKFKKVVRGGKLVKKIVCRDGFVAGRSSDGRPMCIKQTGAEKKARSIAAKKAARSRKGKAGAANRARAKSLTRRRSLIG